MQLYLLREGILDAATIDRLERQVDDEVQRAADRAVRAILPKANPESIKRHVYSEDLSVADARFSTEGRLDCG